MYDGESEYRINTFKNFHSFNKGSWMDYGTYNQRVNTEVNRMTDDMHELDDEDTETKSPEGTYITINNDPDVDHEVDYQDTDYNNGLVIGSDEAPIARGHNTTGDFGTKPDSSAPMTKGIAVKRMTVGPVMTYENFVRNEDISFMNDVLDQDIGELSSISDEYYIMNLKDVDIFDNEKILHVEIIEKNDNSFNGKGTFRYIPSGIKGITGDITPIKMDGILHDMYDEDAEIIIEFIYRIISDLSL